MEPRRLTYANVMATVAVFLALGGSSYAVAQVTGRDVKNGSLTGADIKNKTLRAGDFKASELPSGPPGAAGPAGAPGSAVAYAHVLANGTLDLAASKNVVDVRPFCEDGCATAPPPNANTDQCLKVSVPVKSAVSVAALNTPGYQVLELAPHQATGSFGDSGCPAGYTGAHVRTYGTNGLTSNGSYYIVFN
jgi:hypothetical protein